MPKVLKHHESADDEMKGLLGMYPDPRVADALAGLGHLTVKLTYVCQDIMIYCNNPS